MKTGLLQGMVFNRLEEMIGVLAIVLGLQLILQAIVLDVEHEPGRHRS